MIAFLTFMGTILSVLYIVMLNHVDFTDPLGGIIVSILVFGMATGAHIVKFSRFRKEHMSMYRIVGGILIVVALAFGAPRFVELWQMVENFSQGVFMAWVSLIALYIMAIPVIDYTEDAVEPKV